MKKKNPLITYAMHPLGARKKHYGRAQALDGEDSITFRILSLDLDKHSLPNSF